MVVNTDIITIFRDTIELDAFHMGEKRFQICFGTSLLVVWCITLWYNKSLLLYHVEHFIALKILKPF